MKLIVAHGAGFCMGVKGAVDAAMNTPGKRVTLGKLIHNDYVNERLAAASVGTIDSLAEYTEGTVIIRSKRGASRMSTRPVRSSRRYTRSSSAKWREGGASSSSAARIIPR